MSFRIKGRLYKTRVRPSQMYGTECWALNIRDDKIIEVTEMRMLRWTLLG